ncbi:hypothetical protein TcasGA2_TC012722 [Tribolium castaneum]|uniref:Uncharacterized protein n=1 Tax=Tribolium castaneum TaxID=7070 RepID=D6WZT4_TRICA|nr:hypothetical protein TcasGA2_TC012722 [Tribolium castaneum]
MALLGKLSGRIWMLGIKISHVCNNFASIVCEIALGCFVINFLDRVCIFERSQFIYLYKCATVNRFENRNGRFNRISRRSLVRTRKVWRKRIASRRQPPPPPDLSGPCRSARTGGALDAAAAGFLQTAVRRPGITALYDVFIKITLVFTRIEYLTRIFRPHDAAPKGRIFDTLAA